MAKKEKNRNIVLIKDVNELENEIDYQDFIYKEYFSHICDLIPDRENEKLDIEVRNVENCNKRGLVYVFVIEGKIFKIGHTITSIKDRVSSYNCGKIEYRIAGTNSTTNYFVLQSFLKMNKNINVYAYFPKHPNYEVLGEEFENSFPPSKQAEKKILESMDIIPIGCTQR